MSRSCTPGEWRVALDFLEPLPVDRREPVATFLFEVVGECACGEAVRRCDSRRLVGDRLCHLRCVEARGKRG